EELDGARGRLAHDAVGRLAIRQGHAMRAGCELREISRGRGRLPRLRTGRHDPWRLRLRQGISRRALSARIHAPAHRAGQPRTDPELHFRESARPAEVVLMKRMNFSRSSFRDNTRAPDLESQPSIVTNQHITRMYLSSTSEMPSPTRGEGTAIGSGEVFLLPLWEKVAAEGRRMR